ncbi:hypothetical protein NUW58_g8534 [Xylaria curta]|uniref:Uncharacterized protein n=1 Tax=Xylaria curta TaxID=42375 RepID=A0ACC1N8P9_9PEZI|nr:hypothetical protein NUW58_g8534 [Xylaria curta]
MYGPQRTLGGRQALLPDDIRTLTIQKPESTYVETLTLGNGIAYSTDLPGAAASDSRSSNSGPSYSFGAWVVKAAPAPVVLESRADEADPKAPRVVAVRMAREASAVSLATACLAPLPARWPKPRPMTMMPAQNSAHNNPETAPSIPISLGRSQSTRRGGRPMSEQFTGAAGIVNAMYKGPDGPLSPTLSNPRNSASFFSGVSTPRVASSGQGAPSAGNFPGMRSETSSVSGDSASAGEGPTSSPPRAGSGHASTAGSEKATTDKGTTFAGNKPRPLRLVQENAAEKAENNKRASWIGLGVFCMEQEGRIGGRTY